MKILRLSVMLLLLLSFNEYGQSILNDKEVNSIKQTALDYAVPYYTGEWKRVEKALAADLNKVTPVYLKELDKTVLVYTTHSQLIESTIKKSQSPEEAGGHFNIKILNVNNGIANVKLISDDFSDYLQMVKINGYWKIVNAVWTKGVEAGNTQFDFNSAKKEIIQSVTNYAKGVLYSDPNYLKKSISTEFNKIICVQIKNSDHVLLKRKMAGLLIANTYYEYGKRDTTSSQYKIRILDIMDKVAVTEIIFPFGTEYVQLFKDNVDWKAINCITK